MKRILICIAFALATIGTMAQNKSAGTREEIVVIEGDENGKTFSIFSYTAKGGPLGYWLGLGEENSNFGFPFVFEGKTEKCIYLGADSDEVLATLDSILSCFSLVNDSCEFRAMLADGKFLKYSGVIVCSVERQFIFKRLRFHFRHDGDTTESILTKSDLKYLRRGFLFNTQKEQNAGM